MSHREQIQWKRDIFAVLRDALLAAKRGEECRDARAMFDRVAASLERAIYETVSKASGKREHWEPCDKYCLVRKQKDSAGVVIALTCEDCGTVYGPVKTSDPAPAMPPDPATCAHSNFAIEHMGGHGVHLSCGACGKFWVGLDPVCGSRRMPWSQFKEKMELIMEEYKAASVGVTPAIAVLHCAHRDTLQHSMAHGGRIECLDCKAVWLGYAPRAKRIAVLRDELERIRARLLQGENEDARRRVTFLLTGDPNA